MEQTAYDFARFEAAGRPAEKKQARLRSVKGGGQAPSRWHELFVNFKVVLAAALFLGLAVGLLQSKATITELTVEIQRTQSALTTAQSTYNYLNSELNSKTSMANVEEVANRLGLMKMDESQITYVRLEASGVLTRTETGVKQWADMFSAGVLSLIEKLEF